MTSRVVVRLTGRTGIDDADRLLADLAKETGLDWREEPPSPGGKHLTGIAELILTVLISGAAGKGAEMAVEAAADRARDVVNRWRDRRLDPPEAEIGAQDEPAAQPAAGSQAGQEAEGAAG